jgi:Tfp pilus assembly protein FimV
VVAGLGVGAALALVAAVGGAVLGGDDTPALELAGRSSVVVHSGDTLWSIAVSIAPDTDPREVVDALQEVNGLTDASLVPGQTLLLP